MISFNLFFLCGSEYKIKIRGEKHSRDQFAATSLDGIPQFALTHGIQDFHVTER